MKTIDRVFLLVVDSMGCGAAPDADRFGDEGANTLASIRQSPEWHCPNMEQMGLFHIDGFKPGHVYALPEEEEGEWDWGWGSSGSSCGGLEDLEEGSEAEGEGPTGVFGRFQELSAGKDTTAGHWELAGLVTPTNFPTYPNGFPADVIEAFERETGRQVLCNKPYSGTEVLRDYGEEHMRTGKLIVYTSADSVFQIAAHEEVVPPEELYRYCRIARKIMTGDHGVGRVIARPFIGEGPRNFVRVTAHRHDFSITPPKDTMLDVLQANGLASIGIGKISDIFAGKGLDERFTAPTKSNVDGMDKTIALLEEDWRGLCFVNLVETDSVFGHRRDVDGYARAVSTFDWQLGKLMAGMKDSDVVMITADHGCDPAFRGTDHTREYIPLLAWGKALRPGTDLGTRVGFGDIAATILDIFGINPDTIDGKSWLEEAVLPSGD